MLVVAERIDDIQHLSGQYGERMLRDPGTCILALEPALQAYLKGLKIPYTTTCTFFDKSSHQELAARSVVLLEILRDGLGLRDEFGASSGYTRALVFHLRFFLHHVMFLEHVLHRACVALKPDRVLVADVEQRPVAGRRSPDVARDDSYVARVAREVCRELGLRCDSPLLPAQPITFLARLKTAAIAVGARILFSLADALIGRRARGCTLVLAPSKAHNVGRLLEELRPLLGPRYLPVFLQSSDPRAILTQVFGGTREWSYPGVRVPSGGAGTRAFAASLDRQLARLKTRVQQAAPQFSHRGVDVGPMIEERARTVVGPYLLELYAQTSWLVRFLDAHRPSLVVSQSSVGLTANLGTVAAARGIATILIPHGSMVPSSDPHALAEWREHGLGMTDGDYGHLAVQTPWTESYLQQSPSSCIPVRTGPLLFAGSTHRHSRGEAGRRSADMVLIHVGTPKARDSMRFWTYETVDEYIANINALIRAVEQVGGCRLLVRFRPLDYLSEADFTALLAPSTCYEICSTGSLSDHLSRADVLVSYSSTAIEEALQLCMPVLQFDPQGKYCHVKARVLDPAVTPEVGSCYFVGREDHLAWGLQWLMANHLSAPQPESLWNEHKFETADGLRAFLETMGLVRIGHSDALGSNPEHPAWSRP